MMDCLKVGEGRQERGEASKGASRLLRGGCGRSGGGGEQGRGREQR